MGQTKTLKEMLDSKEIVKTIEFHDMLSAIFAYNSCFDALWASSLTMSAVNGLPDDEISFPFEERLKVIKRVIEIGRNPQSRMYGSSLLDEPIKYINQILEKVAGTEKGRKPIIYDGDSGGTIGYFQSMVKQLEECGVAMVIIEDKIGPKINSLISTSDNATQDDKYKFAEKIKKGIEARTNDSFLIGARIESLILGETINQALERSKVYLEAGSDAILIHSIDNTPDRVLEFAKCYGQYFGDDAKPLIAVPTTYPQIKFTELQNNGFNMVIAANHQLRAKIKSMSDTIAAIDKYFLKQ